MSVDFCDRETIDKPAQPSMSPWTVRAGILAALVSSGCVSQAAQLPLNEPNHATPASLQWSAANKIIGDIPTAEPDQPEVPPGSMVITGSAPNSEPNSKAWPNVPATCVFTGVILINDRYSKPHQILLENMCIQKRSGSKNIYEGKHKWIKADGKGRYKIPFHDSHLEEKPKCTPGRKNGSCLSFVTEKQGKSIKEDLSRGLQQGTLTFEYSLDAHGVRPIVK